MRVSLDIIVPVVAVTSAFFILAISLAIKAYRKKPTTGQEGLIGQTGVVKSRIDPQGKVFIHGEYWDAISDDMIPEGTKVKVTELKNSEIKVKKA